MKKFRISMFLMAALIGVNFNSCKKDDFSEKDAMNLQAQLDKQKSLDQDTLSTKNYRVSYTVTLVDASTSTLKSASAVSAITGAKVKFVQDTTIITKTADASGIVAFSNIKPGNANINITLADYSEVNYTVNLSSSSLSGGRQLSNIIPLIPIAGTSTGIIKGRVIYETDLTNKTPEVVPTGTKIIATVKSTSAALPSTGSGNITSISYDKLSLSATTDASGNFSMTVPATILGLEYDIIVSDFTADQKLLQDTYFSRDTFGVLTIPTNFGSSFQTASTVTVGTFIVVTVGAPDYTFTPAVANAVIDNSNGIGSINITNNGALYAQHAGYSIPLDDATIKNGSTSTGTASFNVNSFGRVTDISVSSAGFNYLPAAENFELTIPYVLVEGVVSVTVAGGVITAASITNKGKYFINRPEDVTFTYNGGAGTGATFTPSFIFTGGVYELLGVTITNGGSGYTNGTQTYNVQSILSQKAKANLHLTSSSLSAISVTDQGSNYINGVNVVLGSPNVNGGTQATATAILASGKIVSIAVTQPGSGYTSAPSVSIVNKAEKVQAKFTAMVLDGQVSGFKTVNAGNGYLAVPIVTITPSISGAGSGASAIATVSGGQVSLNLVNKGNGYRGNLPASEKPYSGTSSIIVKGSATSIVNIDLGTGKRTIEK